MLINKDGKIIANASQPTVIFETVEEYNDWYAKLPLKPTSTQAEIDKILSRFVIIKKYETVEIEGMVIFCTTEADMKGTTGATETHEKIDGALYVVRQNNKIYRYQLDSSVVPAADQWILVGGTGGLEFANTATSFPGTSAAGDATHGKFPIVILPTGYEKEDRFFIARDTMSLYVIMEVPDVVIPPAPQTYHYEYVEVSSIIDNVIVKEYSAKTKLAANVPNYTNKGDIPSGTAIAYCTTDNKFYTYPTGGSITELSDTDLVDGDYIFPISGSTNMIYVAKKEGTIYIWDTSLASPDYLAVGGDDEVQVFKKKADFPDIAKAAAGKLFVALDETQAYVADYYEDARIVTTDPIPATGDGSIIYIVGTTGSRKAQTIDSAGVISTIGDEGLGSLKVLANKEAFPVPGTASTCYIATDNWTHYTWNATTGEYVLDATSTKQYINITNKATIIYSSKSLFPKTGKEGLIYIAKDTGKMYYFDASSPAADKYIKLGDCEDVVVDTQDNIDAMAKQEGVLYIAYDQIKDTSGTVIKETKVGYIYNATENRLVEVMRDGLPEYTQAEWDALTTKPSLAIITDSVFDAEGYLI